MEWSCSWLVVTAAALQGFCQAQARNICLSSKRTPVGPVMGKEKKTINIDQNVKSFMQSLVLP